MSNHSVQDHWEAQAQVSNQYKVPVLLAKGVLLQIVRRPEFGVLLFTTTIFTGSFYQPLDGTGQLEALDRDIEYAKVHTQVSKL